MPNIPVYTSRVPTPGPNTALIQAKAAEGQAYADIAGSVAKTFGNIYQQQQEGRALEESANIAASIATTQADLDLRLKDDLAKADPNAEDFGDFSANWLDSTANPAIDKIGQGATSSSAQRQAREAQAKLRGMYRVKSSMGQSSVSGANAVKNINTLGNVQADSVFNDPSLFDISIGIIDHSIQGLIAGGMDRDSALELQRTMNARVAEAAAKGAANLNPATAEKNLERYKEYLPQTQQDEVRTYIEQQKNGLEADRLRAEAEAEKKKRDAAEAAESDITSQLILNPTKVDPRKDIAGNPALTGPQKQRLFDNLNQELKRLKGGDEPDKHGPGFWNAWNRVFDNGFRNTDEIYALADKGGPLTIPEAHELATRWKERREGAKVGDFDSERIAGFFRSIHDDFIDNGGTDEDYFQLYNDKLRAIEFAKSKGVPLADILDSKNSNYIGKDVDKYISNKPTDDYVAPTAPKDRTWQEFFGTMFSGTDPAQQLEKNIKSGEEGAAQGAAALRALITSGQMTKQQAAEYGKKRGWFRPSGAAQQVAPVGVDKQIPGGISGFSKGKLDPKTAGDNWATFEVANDGYHLTLVLPTRPDDKPANDATGYLGSAIERWSKDKTQAYGPPFEDEDAAQAFMRGAQKSR